MTEEGVCRVAHFENGREIRGVVVIDVTTLDNRVGEKSFILDHSQQ